MYLIPTIGAIAIGTFFAPNFAVGLAAGAALGAANIVILVALQTLGIVKPEETESEYAKTLREFPASGTVVAPVIEELLFRGGLQPLMARAIVWIVPAAAAAFLGTPLSVATTVAIVATAAIFGFAHLFNSHPNAHWQAIFSTMGGISFGLIAAQFGLPAAIAAHIANNTLAITMDQLVRKPEQPASTTTTTRV